jgi:hypothetical protein
MATRTTSQGITNALASQARHLTAGVADDLDRSHEEAELHAVALGVVDFGLVGRHLLAAAAIGHPDLGRAQSDGGSRGVHGHVATAHDHDSPAGQIRLSAELRGSQELEARHHALQILSGDVEAGRGLGARRHQDGVETVAAEPLQI